MSWTTFTLQVETVSWAGPEVTHRYVLVRLSQTTNGLITVWGCGSHQPAGYDCSKHSDNNQAEAALARPLPTSTDTLVNTRPTSIWKHRGRPRYQISDMTQLCKSNPLAGENTQYMKTIKHFTRQEHTTPEDNQSKIILNVQSVYGLIFYSILQNINTNKQPL